MKKFVLAAAAVVMSAGMAMADPLEGVWRTVPDDNGASGLVQVSQCGSALCGTLVKAIDSNGAEIASENIGRQIIWDMAPAGGGEYRGKIWSPDRDKTYNSRLLLIGNSLAVSGCVLGICRDGGTWKRQ